VTTRTLARDVTAPLSTNLHLLRWVRKMADLVQPASIHWVDGSEEEHDLLIEQMLRTGTLVRLNEDLWPGCFYARSDPNDVARVEARTFVCSLSKDNAGPTNNWVNPFEMRARMRQLFNGAMAGRTMYVLAFSMGVPGSPMSRIAVQLTDSPYVVVSMRTMARIGIPAIQEIDKDTQRVVPCIHSVGVPLAPGQADVPWPCNPEKYIVHFPETREIWSYGSGYGGNALLGKKCFGLRIASNIARDEGWMAEHMLILGRRGSERREDLHLAAFPSACGKTNLADDRAARRDEGLEGDDRRRRHRLDPADATGHSAGDQPGGGILSAWRPGTSEKTNPNAMTTIARNTIFTNVALTPEGGVWWEGMTDQPARRVPRLARRTVDARDRPRHRQAGRAPRTRGSPRRSRSVRSSIRSGRRPEGVPISAIVFGGRRAHTLPLIYQSFNWSSGVYAGATMGSETTAAATGSVGALRRDPMAMLPFCGYHMGDYFRHWIKMQRLIGETPKIFQVNWFRKDEAGRFLWPGYRENMRVLKWIVDRVHGRVLAKESPIGWMPRYEDFDWRGLDLPKEQFEELQRVDPALWRREVIQHEELFIDLHDHLPPEMVYERELLICRL
jgi:phosphoenolpyruvate carboxykinase (GTP)